MLEIIQTILLLVLVFAVLYKPKHKLKTTNKKVILDTCALIDGRIVELAKSGFVSDELVVPEFIVHELQMLADGNDSHKRSRARFGLDAVKELQDIRHVNVTIDRSEAKTIKPTDDKLVTLAKKLGAPLYTTDYNLTKVAEIEGVQVLNVNELSQNIRPVVLPGERKKIKIVQKGSNPRQGVGYLEDGTMLVVDNAAKLVGKTVEVEVSRMHQTVAGKMVFAELTK